MENPCIYCKSKYVIKCGNRKTLQRGQIHIYKCKKCTRTFCKDNGFKYKKKPEETISKTRQRKGFKSLETRTLQFRLLFIYYNFIRKHSAIGMTPAEMAELIDYLNADNEKKKWKFLIKRAIEKLYCSLIPSIICL